MSDYMESEAVEWETWDIDYINRENDFQEMIFNVNFIVAAHPYYSTEDYTRILMGDGRAYIIKRGYDSVRSKLYNYKARFMGRQ
ncbi:MAG: hypothetical protein LUD47_07920 [Clostridia bacterium]|nr:hypothetical protein [Clostridia bacterium]